MENSNKTLVLTPSEARKILRCSKTVFYDALRRQVIPSIRISPRKIIIPKHAFMRWLDEGGGNNLHPQ